MLNFKKTLTTLVLAGSLLSDISHADIIISGTHIIYDKNRKNVSIHLENKDTRPLLVQNRIDFGNDSADPGSARAPFISTPPIPRVEPKHSQSVKVMFTQITTLPKDCESVFWFNVLEVPPEADANKEENKNLLQLTFHTRIKLSYRPADLQGSPAEATKRLRWQMGNKQDHTTLRVNSPTPYYVSFNDAVVTVGGEHYTVDATMVAPLSNASFNVKSLQDAVSGKLDYHAINDYGGMIEGSVSL